MQQKEVYADLIRIMLILILILSSLNARSQNWFRYKQQQTFLTASPNAYLYKVPRDSVYRKAYLQQPYLNDSWMNQPAAIVPANKIDSALASELVPGYYLAVRAAQDKIHLTMHRKAGFHVFILQLGKAFYADVRDNEGRELRNAIVKVGSKQVAYDEGMKSYPLPFANGDVISIAAGDDIVFYDCEKKKIHKEQDYEDYYSYYMRDHAAEVMPYNGYLVTNQPKYRLLDTVRYKAYMLEADDKYPVREHQHVTLVSEEGRIYDIHTCLPAAKGVYYNQFVLGDSLKPGTYTLTLTGERTKAKMTQTIRLDDYLLDELTLQVKGEGLPVYQPGDSIHLYAYAATANGLPVADGRLQVTVRPALLRTRQDSIFVPDTLYQYTTDVAPDGETHLGFSTKDFPKADMMLHCTVRLMNSNFETKDTSFDLTYSTAPYYLKLWQAGNQILAEAIQNKKSAAGVKGSYINRKGKEVRIIYPHQQEMDVLKDSYTYNLLNDTGGVSGWKTYYVQHDSIAAMDAYAGDTACLHVQNPQRIPVRYAIYRGNKLVTAGTMNGDTTLKAESRRGDKVTVLMSYIWQGRVIQKQQEIKRYDKNIQIAIGKKDIVYPGQTDSITVLLQTVSGKPVKATNLTVVAFNTQFREENVPEIYADEVQHRGLDQDKYERWVTEKHLYMQRSIPVNRIWLEKCGADTLFFYDKLLLSRSGVGVYQFALDEHEAPTQVAVYVRLKEQNILPVYVQVDDKPVYIGMADAGTNPQAIAVDSGMHNLTIRTAKDLYMIKGIVLPPHVKTNIFVNGDSIAGGEPYVIKGVGSIARDTLADTLNYTEQSLLGRYLLQYRNEYESQAYFYQHHPDYIQYICRPRQPWVYDREKGYELVGPLSMYDSISFFQPANTKTKFQPETGYIISLREKMMRLEHHNVYAALNKRLQHTELWPSPNDTLAKVIPFAALQVNSEQRSYLSVMKDTLLYGFQNLQAYPSLQSGHARLQVQLPRQEVPQYIILHSCDSGQVFLKPDAAYGSPTQLPPGSYDLFVMTKTQRFYASRIYLKDDGMTVLSVKDTLAAFTEAACAAWLHPYLCILKGQVYKPGEWRIETIWDGSVRTNPKGGISIAGKVLDDQNEPIIGAIVQLIEDGIARTGTQTDEEGEYTIPPIKPGKYDIRVQYIGYKECLVKDVIVKADRTTEVNVKMEVNNDVSLMEVVVCYKMPVIDRYNPGSRTTVTSEEIEKMPVRHTNALASTSANVYTDEGLNITGAREASTHYYIDGVQLRGGERNMTQGTITGMTEEETDRIATGSRKLMQSTKMQSFINSFLQNNGQFGGMRSNFRDWAIWEPNLWTDEDGRASFTANYPDNITSWKTYVLAMNEKGYGGKAFSLTRSFKPLAAELRVPRFLRYGDTVYAVGKVMNYTPGPFSVHTSFTSDKQTLFTDSILVHQAWTRQIKANAPAMNRRDTTYLSMSFGMQTADGYKDGEERIVPVYPVGATETKGIFLPLTSDTIFSSMPDTTGNYTGHTTVHIDGSLTEVLLQEIENLKVYPHGCTEQLTTKLIAIYYEEEIKRLLHHDNLNNETVKKKILEKLIAAQHQDGSFGWFKGDETDYRITNYVISTMYKVNKDGWLDYIIRRGLAYLDQHLAGMSTENCIASLATLSAAGYTSNYKPHIDRLKTYNLNTYNRAVLVKIAKEQQLPYRAALDTLMAEKVNSVHGSYWGAHSYDWYRNDLATTLLVYQIVAGDSVYGHLKDEIIKYLLYKRNNGYYANTAESGLILTTLLPELLKNNKGREHKPTEIVLTGALADTIRSFPYTRELKSNYAPIRIAKQGFSPVYLSVAYDYLNIAPERHDGTFKVHSFFTHGRDSVATLKQGEKVMVRTIVTCDKEAEYVMVEVPIPAGCVPVSGNSHRGDRESSRENYKDRTVIYCSYLPKGSHTFDVELEVRYKGLYNISPARAQMMYFAHEYGHTEVKKIAVH